MAAALAGAEMPATVRLRPVTRRSPPQGNVEPAASWQRLSLGDLYATTAKHQARKVHSNAWRKVGHKHQPARVPPAWHSVNHAAGQGLVAAGDPAFGAIRDANGGRGGRRDQRRPGVLQPPEQPAWAPEHLVGIVDEWSPTGDGASGLTQGTGIAAGYPGTTTPPQGSRRRASH